MKVQNNAKLSSILGGDFVGGEMVWWRGDQIPLGWTAFLNELVFVLGRGHLFVVLMSYFLLSSPLLNGHFAMIYHTSAIDTLSMAYKERQKHFEVNLWIFQFVTIFIVMINS